MGLGQLRFPFRAPQFRAAPLPAENAWLRQLATARALEDINQTPVQGWLPFDRAVHTRGGEVGVDSPWPLTLGPLHDAPFDELLRQIQDARVRGYGALTTDTSHHSYPDALLLAEAGDPTRNPVGWLQRHTGAGNESDFFRRLLELGLADGAGRF